MFKKNLPQSPGVYWFKDKKNKVLYVGKAKNLKNRILSYRLINSSSTKTFKMLNQSNSIQFKITDSEFEAIILEAELIKIHQPQYNILLKDDKSPIYIYISNHLYPQVKTERLKNLKKIKVKKYNLFGPFPSGYKAKQVLKFTRKVFPFCNAKNPTKACFYYHLNLCPGACIKKISISEYKQNITNLKLFLKGKKKRLIQSLKKSMLQKSKLKQFEEALIIKDQIKILESLTQINLKPELEIPQLEVDKNKQQLNHLKRLLRRFISLPANYPLTRIEAYDVSNLQGKQATGSMVVFKKAKPDTSQYRMFKIKSINKPNDPQMLKEIISRRVKHEKWGIPNLIIIDGGKTQLKASLSAIPWNIPVVSIAKNPDRLLIPNQLKKTITTIKLDPKNPATHLIQYLRNESHRFAINYHKKLREKLFNL